MTGAALTAQPAAAQDAASIQSIQRQILQLQQQLKRLQSEATQRDLELKQAQDEAAQARAAAAQASAASQLVVPPSVSPGAAIVTIPPNDVDKTTGRKFYNPNKANGSITIGGVTVTLGGFADLTAYGRSRNEQRGTPTSFTGIPFQGPTGQAASGEFGLTAQQTRISLRATANPGPGQTVVGYVEADFRNGAGNANSVQTYSYTPRLRQAFGEYAYDPWNAYVLAGQAWSLVTPFKKALDPFSTWQPPVIDPSYLPGYAYGRIPVVRVVKGFGPAWLGLEADSPQTVFGGSAPTISGGKGTVLSTLAGAGDLNPATNYSVNVAPDIIAKGAIDTAFGHYEVFGLARFFRDTVTSSSTTAVSATATGRETNNTAFGGGVGVSAYVPIAKFADVFGSALYGDGVGRYGSGGLPDVTYAADGSIKPLHEGQVNVGVIGHVTPKFDIYGVAGLEAVGGSYAGAAGYGNPTKSNVGCYNPNSTAYLAGVAAPVPGAVTTANTCTGNTSRLEELTVGYNWKLLKGKFGTIQTGLQYGYIERHVFGSVGGSPTGVENVFYANVRYLPFE